MLGMTQICLGCVATARPNTVLGSLADWPLSQLIRGSQDSVLVGNAHHALSLPAPVCFLPSKYFQEDAHSWESHPSAIDYPTGGEGTWKQVGTCQEH